MRSTQCCASKQKRIPARREFICNRGAVLYRGALAFFDSVTEACEVHHALQMRGV